MREETMSCRSHTLINLHLIFTIEHQSSIQNGKLLQERRKPLVDTLLGILSLVDCPITSDEELVSGISSSFSQTILPVGIGITSVLMETDHDIPLSASLHK